MKKHLHIWLSLAVLAGAVVARQHDPPFVNRLRDAVFDTYQQWKPRDYQPVPVRVVDIDDETLAKIGQWPWPRTFVADLVNRLKAMGAAAVVFDVLFTEPDRTSPSRIARLWPDIPDLQTLENRLPDHDRIFADALRTANAVIGFFLTNDSIKSRSPTPKAGFATTGDDPKHFTSSYRTAVPPLHEFEQASKGIGVVNVPTDSDGVIRRLPLLYRIDGNLYPSLTAEALRIAQGAGSYVIKSSGASSEQSFGTKTGIVAMRIGNLVVPTDGAGRLWIHFTGPVPERTVPVWKVLKGTVPARNIQGHIVLIGASAAGLMDRHVTPVVGVMPGAEIHALAIEQILTQSWLSRPDWTKGAEILFFSALGLLVIGLINFLGAWWSAAIGGGAVAMSAGGSWLAFSKHGMLFDPLYPAITLIAVYLVSSLVRHAQSEKQQRWIRDAFSSYVSPNLVEQLVNNPETLKLGGERREMTFLFTDLAGFTSLIEQSEPSDVIPLLNEYLDEMVRITFKHDGTIDKIVGDAVTVMFSTPVPQEDHPARAVACALEMDAFAHAYAAKKQAEGIPLGETRIGVNSGMVMIGNFGGEAMFDYTAHGDAINTAARLESVNKHLGTRVCISANTADQSPGFIGRPVGNLVLKGKTEGLAVFEPLSEEDAASPAMASYMAAYALLEMENPTAEEGFQEVLRIKPDDPLARFHLNRLENGETGITIVMAEK